MTVYHDPNGFDDNFLETKLDKKYQTKCRNLSISYAVPLIQGYLFVSYVTSRGLMFMNYGMNVQDHLRFSVRGKPLRRSGHCL